FSPRGTAYSNCRTAIEGNRNISRICCECTIPIICLAFILQTTFCTICTRVIGIADSPGATTTSTRGTTTSAVGCGAVYRVCGSYVNSKNTYERKYEEDE